MYKGIAYLLPIYYATCLNHFIKIIISVSYIILLLKSLFNNNI